MLHESGSCRLADAGDAESRQKTLRFVLLCLFDGCKQLIRVFFLADNALGNQLFPMLLQAEDVDDRVKETFFNQGGDVLFAQALDVHGVAAHEIQDVALHLRRTCLIDALDVGGIRLSLSLCTADGAAIADLERLCSLGTLFFYDRLDLRNDLSRLVDDDGIAYAHIEIVDEILIVQRRALDRRTAKADGIERRRRRDAPRPADRKRDAAHDAFLFLGRVFIGDRPARRLGSRAKALPLQKIIEFDDSAVDVVGQIAARGADLLDGIPDLLCRTADVIGMNDLDALPFHEVVGFDMRLKFLAAHRLQIEHEEGQSPLLRDAAVELAQSARRTVARIGKKL